jgi:hypothetical protein
MALNAKSQLAQGKFKGKQDLTGIHLLPSLEPSVNLKDTVKKELRIVQATRSNLRKEFKSMGHFSLVPFLMLSMGNFLFGCLCSNVYRKQSCLPS